MALALAPGSPQISGWFGTSGSGWGAFAESFAPSLTGIGYWRLLFQFLGYRSISDFILPKSVFPVVAILSDDELRLICSMWRTSQMSHDGDWRDTCVSSRRDA